MDGPLRAGLLQLTPEFTAATLPGVRWRILRGWVCNVFYGQRWAQGRVEANSKLDHFELSAEEVASLDALVSERFRAVGTPPSKRSVFTPELQWQPRGG